MDEPKNLLDRTKEFALRVIRLYSGLPKTNIAQTLGHQLLRSATSVGAHYREAQRGKSNPDFISKIEGALQELEESRYWLELLIGAEIISEKKLAPLLAESSELIAIFMTIAKKAKSR